MGSVGTFKVGLGYGGAGASYDEELPQAYEQVSDAYSNSMNMTGGYLSNNTIVWDSPAYDMGGATVSLDIAFSPDANSNGAIDGGSATHGAFGLGYGAGVTISGLAEGFNCWCIRRR